MEKATESLCMSCPTEVRDCPWLLTHMAAMCPGQAVLKVKRTSNSHDYSVYMTIRCGKYTGTHKQHPLPLPANAITDPAKTESSEPASRPAKEGFWTAERDRQMLKLRKEDRTWAEIGEILGRSATGCSQRYRTLTGHKAKPVNRGGFKPGWKKKEKQ